MYGRIGFAEYFVFYRVPLSNGRRDWKQGGMPPCLCRIVVLRNVGTWRAASIFGVMKNFSPLAYHLKEK